MTIARFKTPGLRDLSHSAPYMHTGKKDSLQDVIRFYMDAARLAVDGQLRNGASEIKDISLAAEDVDPLTAFLRALNEDYQ